MLIQISGGNGHSYLYIDEVSLKECQTTAVFKNEDLKINVFPNPFIGILNFEIQSNERYEIIIYDVFTRKILSNWFTNSASINTTLFTSGVYFYEVRSKNSLIKKGKITKF